MKTALTKCLILLFISNVSFAMGMEITRKVATPLEKIAFIRAINNYCKVWTQIIQLDLDYKGYLYTGFKLETKFKHVKEAGLGFEKGYFGFGLNTAMLEPKEIVFLLKYPQLGNLVTVKKLEKKGRYVLAEEETELITKEREELGTRLTAEDKKDILDLYNKQNTPDSIKLSIGCLFIALEGEKVREKFVVLQVELYRYIDTIGKVQNRRFPQSMQKLGEIYQKVLNFTRKVIEIEVALKNHTPIYSNILEYKDEFLNLCKDLEIRIKKVASALKDYRDNYFSLVNSLYKEVRIELGIDLADKLEFPSFLEFPDEVIAKPLFNDFVQIQQELGLQDIDLEKEPSTPVELEKFLPKEKPKKKPTPKKKPKKKERVPKKEKEPEIKEEKEEEEEIKEAPPLDTIIIKDEKFGVTITLFKAKIEESERPRIGKLEYTKTIDEWFSNPEKLLKEQYEQFDPKKKKKLALIPEKRQEIVFLHAFSKKVDQHINECGKWKQFLNKKTDTQDYYIKMPAQVKEADGKSYLAMIEYAVTEKKDYWLCYHRNLVKVPSDEFFAEWFGFAHIPIPQEIYEEEFPPLGK